MLYHIGKVLLLLFGLTVVASAPSALAQIGFGTDIEYSTRYVSRGLTSRNYSVIQPGIFVKYSRAGTILSTGGWTSIEPGTVQSDDIGTDKFIFGEVDLWAEVARDLGAVDAAVGIAGYHFDRSATTRLLHDVHDTYELYAGARIGEWIVVPRAVAWYDFDAVKGLFVEAGATFRIPGWRKVMVPLGSLLLEANTGFSVGQERNHDEPGERFYFEERGLAYVDVSLGTTIGHIPTGILNNAVHLELHVQINRDDRTKLVGGSENNDVKWWLSMTLTSVGPRCRPTRELCPP